jgi:hypothetical protein
LYLVAFDRFNSVDRTSLLSITVAFVISVAVLLGLLLFLYHEVRRPPGPMEWGRVPKWKKKVRVSLATIPVALAILGFWAVFVEPNRLVVRHETIQIEIGRKNLPVSR